MKHHVGGEDGRVWTPRRRQRADGCEPLTGVMIEGSLFEGAQPLKKPSELQYGVSITDACLGWDVTERMLRHGADVLRRSTRKPVPATA